jgi:hypothetical protein
MSATTEDLDRPSNAVLWMLPRFQESGDVVAAVTEALEICAAETSESVSLPIVTATPRLGQGRPVESMMTDLIGDVSGRVGSSGWRCCCSPGRWCRRRRVAWTGRPS